MTWANIYPYQSGQGATPIQGAPGWLALNPVRGMRERHSWSIQLQKLQFQSVIYGNPGHSNWNQNLPIHIWLLLAQCRILAGFINTMQAEETQIYKIYINVLHGKTEKWIEKSNISKNHLSTVYLESNKKINCATSEIQ